MNIWKRLFGGRSKTQSSAPVQVARLTGSTGEPKDKTAVLPSAPAKVPCKRCGALILSSTARDNSGFCRNPNCRDPETAPAEAGTMGGGPSVTKPLKRYIMKDMPYMEVSGNDRQSGLCSDDTCPCGSPGTRIPRGKGYMYVSEQVVNFRTNCLTQAEALRKIELVSRTAFGSMLFASSGVFAPILMCEEAAKRRGLDLDVAAKDANYWWNTGLVPLRATPLRGK